MYKIYANLLRVLEVTFFSKEMHHLKLCSIRILILIYL